MTEKIRFRARIYKYEKEKREKIILAAYPRMMQFYARKVQPPFLMAKDTVLLRKSSRYFLLPNVTSFNL